MTVVGITTILEMKNRLRAVKRTAQGLPGGMGLPCGSAGKESAGNAGDRGSIPELGRSPEEEGKATHSSILAWRIPWTV